jgi:hypothetical protein
MVDIQLPRNRLVDYTLSRAPSIFSLKKFFLMWRKVNLSQVEEKRIREK